MVQIKKCQSKKHNGQGCDDPRCPQRVSTAAALHDAVLSGNLNEFLAIKEKIEDAPLSGIAGIIWKKKQTQEFENEKLLLDDKKENQDMGLESYPDFRSLQKGLNDRFRPKATLILEDLGRDTSGYNLRGISVEDMQVRPEFQGMGIGRYMRATILKFADEHNYVVTGIPTDVGDGTVRSHEEGFLEHALSHRRRLEQWYLNHGYEYNHAFSEAGKPDHLTGGNYPYDSSWKSQLHPAAIEYLSGSGFYVRWPNNEIPDNWKADALKT